MSNMAIRLASPNDAEAIASIYAYYVAHTPISFEVAPPTSEDMRGRIEHTVKRFPYLVYETDGRDLFGMLLRAQADR